MVSITLTPKKSKNGIDADIENLELRLEIQKKWIKDTKKELDKLRKLKKEQEDDV